MKLSKRVMEIKPSATLAMSAKARQMKADGKNVISFATGEPDFATPSNITSVCKRALDDGLTFYPPSAGIPELKKAIVSKLKADNNLIYDESEIAVTCGAKQAIYNALQVLINDGDEVIIPAPYWVSYPDQVLLAGGKCSYTRATDETKFKITPAMLEQAITGRTRAIILNSPSNPSGSAYTREELKTLGDMLVKRNIAIISDEIYEKLVYDGFEHTSIVSACPNARDITILINGVSKSHAMTGWRMGYAAGPKEVISKMVELIGQQITGIPAFVQKACVEALTGPQTEVKRMCESFKKRRDLMHSLMMKIPHVRCHKPEGAFYLLPNMMSYLGKKYGANTIDNADALAMYLLEEGLIATVSGAPFGAPECVRFSYATSEANIKEGMRRLGETLGKLI